MKYALVDFKVTEEEIENIKKLGIEPIICPNNPFVYDAISGHPDIMLHVIDDKNIVIQRNIDPVFIDRLTCLGFQVFLSKNSLNNVYPQDIILNAVSTDYIFLHNLKHTDRTLLTLAKNKKLINVNQGYTKCSTAIIAKNAIITSDNGIAKALHAENFHVLLLPPGDILLEGLNYGFIGGCCGLLEKGLIGFYGELEHYEYKKQVYGFLKQHKVDAVFLKKGKLTDRGSIILVTSC